MRIFDETKTKEITNPDLEKGYLRPDKLLIAHHEAQKEVQEQKHLRLLNSYPNGGKEYIEVIDVPYQPAKEAWDEYEDIQVYIPYTEEELAQIENSKLNAKYIPSASKSMAAFVSAFASSSKDDDLKLSISGLIANWQEGNHVQGELANVAGQTWECYSAHDNAVYPDIIPSNLQTWANFWRPLHAKSKENARPWAKPVSGTTDMYHVGEYMIFSDEKIYKCVRDTVYSPEEYAADWEVQA